MRVPAPDWVKIIHVLIGMVLVLLLFACGPRSASPPGVETAGEGFATVLVKNRSGAPVELYIRGAGRERSLRVYPPSECIKVIGLSTGQVEFGLRVLADTRVTWSDHPIELQPGDGWQLVVNGWRQERHDLVGMKPIAQCDGQRTAQGLWPGGADGPVALPRRRAADSGPLRGLVGATAPNEDRSLFGKSLTSLHLARATTYNIDYVTFGVDNRRKSLAGLDLQPPGIPLGGPSGELFAKAPRSGAPLPRARSCPPLTAVETGVGKFSRRNLRPQNSQNLRPRHPA